jgi:hypothetical protein
MKEFTNLLIENIPIKEIKEKFNMELIVEDARGKIYAKALELKKHLNPLEALELMITMNGFITEQIKWFYLYVKCLVMSNQYKEIEPWKYDISLYQRFN